LWAASRPGEAGAADENAVTGVEQDNGRLIQRRDVRMSSDIVLTFVSQRTLVSELYHNVGLGAAKNCQSIPLKTNQVQKCYIMGKERMINKEPSCAI
jgi:hypothetical protein